MKQIRLLIVEPGAEIRAAIKNHAALENFAADEAADGITALKLFRRNDYHIIIMEANLEELDAWHVCQQIRKSSRAPIIMLSKQSSEEEKLLFYEIGADDFIEKPFSYKELIARINVLLRHSKLHEDYTPRRLIFDGLCIDIASRIVFVDGESVMLTPKEYKLLLFLAKNPNRAMTRETILSEVWGDDFFGTDRTVDTHIKTLRENIKPYHNYIGTVWGYGYMFKT
ncbi:MAG: response regulator transcription factor [Christensenellales bacterium]